MNLLAGAWVADSPAQPARAREAVDTSRNSLRETPLDSMVMGTPRAWSFSKISPSLLFPDGHHPSCCPASGNTGKYV